jgi:hypothetical protein
MYAIYEELLEQVLGNISPVGEYFAEQFIVKSFVFQWVTVVCVRLGNDKDRDYFTIDMVNLRFRLRLQLSFPCTAESKYWLNSFAG